MHAGPPPPTNATAHIAKQPSLPPLYHTPGQVVPLPNAILHTYRCHPPHLRVAESPIHHATASHAVHYPLGQAQEEARRKP